MSVSEGDQGLGERKPVHSKGMGNCVHWYRRAGGAVVPAAVLELADQLLLLRVHADHGLPCGQVLAGLVG